MGYCNDQYPGPQNVQMTIMVSGSDDSVYVGIQEIVCGQSRLLSGDCHTKDFKSFILPEYETREMLQMIEAIARRFGILQATGFTFEP